MSRSASQSFDQDPRWDRERLQSILETAVDAIVTIDERGQIEAVNPAVERLFGYSSAELVGQNVKVLAAEPDQSQHDDYMRRYLETGVRKIIGIGRKVVAQHKDGHTFPVSLAVSESKIGDRVVFTGILRDLTGQVAVEEALRAERDFIAAVLDTTGGLVVVLDRDGKIVRFNKSCERLTGRVEDEVVGLHVWDFLLPQEEVEGVRQVFSRLLSGEAPSEFENCWLDRDGEPRLIAWSNTVMIDAAGEVEYVIGTGIEITEQRQVQEHIAQQEKLAAVGQLAAGVAHEVGNPLASISAVVQTMRRKLEGDYARGKLDLIAKHIDRISTIVRQMVDFARTPRLKWAPCNVNEILAETIEMARFDRRAKQVVVVTSFDEKLALTCAVRDQLSQVFLNMVLNAFDAMERNAGDDVASQKKELAISTRTVLVDGIRSIAVVFEDTGPGMTEEVVRRALEPFFTTKDVGQGTGLGLAVSYGIIQDHGGDILIDGRPGEGARVTVTIPILERPPE